MTMQPEQSSGVQAGPSRPRDAKAIKRKMMVAITEADGLLWYLLVWGGWDVGDEVRNEIRRVRGLLAEWRLTRSSS